MTGFTPLAKLQNARLAFIVRPKVLIFIGQQGGAAHLGRGHLLKRARAQRDRGKKLWHSDC
ncbi:hypothetical protein AYI87_17860 [Shewanella sp. KCT]|nr:hypothetical protein AYI87_17860 [Shewanella sp. KCT]